MAGGRDLNDSDRVVFSISDTNVLSVQNIES